LIQSNNLVFIVSQPRSGSTLVQGILSNNDLVNTTSEPWLLLPFFNIFDESLIQARYNHFRCISGVRDYLNGPASEKLLLDSLRTFLLSLYSPLFTGSVRYVLDKTPRYYEILPHIHKVFPEAKIILLKRHPLAVLKSVIQSWSDGNSIESLHLYWRDILEAPKLIQSYLEQFAGSDGLIKELSYENFVQNPGEQTASLYDWLNLDFDPSVLNYSKNKKYRGNMGDPSANFSRKTPNVSGIDSWKDMLEDPYWGDFFKGYAYYLGDDFLKAFGGYSVENACETKIFQDFLSVAGEDSSQTQQVAKIYKSLSWRVTKPLRWMARLILRK